MKSFSVELALAAAGVALLTVAGYAQTPNDAAHVGAHPHVATHHPVYDRHAYHTGAAHHAAAIYNQAAPSGAPYASNNGGYSGPEGRPLYNDAVRPIIGQGGVACAGGHGFAYYPNPMSYDESAAVIEQGGQFTLDRGYPGCFAYIGE